MQFDNIRFDANGIFTFSMGEQIECYNPSEVAMQAMLGIKVMDVYQVQRGILNPVYIDITCIGNNTKDKYAFKAKEWLLNNARIENNRAIWDYNYSCDFHGQKLEVPWYSAFAQAYVAEALMYWARFDSNPIYKTLARQAINQLLYPLEKGGCCNQILGGVWFEEIPYGKCTHIFNAHLISIIALFDAKKYLQMRETSPYIRKALRAFEKNIFRMDTGINSVYEILDTTNAELRIVPGSEEPIILEEIQLCAGNENRVIKLNNNLCFEGTEQKILGSDWIRNEKNQLVLIKKQSAEQNNYLYFYNINTRCKHIILTIIYEVEKDTTIKLQKNCYEAGFKNLGYVKEIKLSSCKKSIDIKIPTSSFLPHLSKVYHVYHTDLLKGIYRRYPKKIYSKLISRFESYW